MGHIFLENGLAIALTNQSYNNKRRDQKIPNN